MHAIREVISLCDAVHHEKCASFSAMPCKKVYVSDKFKAGFQVKVKMDTHNVRDQKLLRMRSTLGGYALHQQTLRQSPRRNILPVHMPLGGMRPISSYLRGGSSKLVNPLLQLLEPLPHVTGTELFKVRYKVSMTERQGGGGTLSHNMARAFFPLAVGLGLRPQSIGVGGDIGKILDDSPDEQKKKKKSTNSRKRRHRGHDEQQLPCILSVGVPSLAFALELENGSDEKDWWRSPGDLLNVTSMSIRMLPQHFIFNGAWERAVVLLCNLHFLSAKVSLFGLEEVLRDITTACAGLDIECKKFPDLKTWQDIYGTLRSQCYEYKRFLVGNTIELSADVACIFAVAIDKDWGTCSQDARFALEQVQASVMQLEAIIEEAADQHFLSDMHEIIKVGRLIDNVRIASKHGLLRCHNSGQAWEGIAEQALRLTSAAWCPQPQEAEAKDARFGEESASPDGNPAPPERHKLHASLTTFLRNGMRMTEQLATTTITARTEPRWYNTNVNNSYLVNDLVRLLVAVEAVRKSESRLNMNLQLPVCKVGLFLSTLGGMTVERKLLTQLVLPAVAKYVRRVSSVELTWTDLRSSGPENEFRKNCIQHSLNAIDDCRIAHHDKILAMFVTAESQMLSQAQVYQREKVNVKRFAAAKKTQLDHATAFMAKLQVQLQQRFASIFEAWTYFDINGDWSVSTVEFMLEYEKLKMTLGVKEVLKVIDKDGYGEIDVHEFVGALVWHELPGGGSKDAIDKTVMYYALRRKSVLKNIHERLARFHETNIDDCAEEADSPLQKDSSPENRCLSLRLACFLCCC